MLPLRPFITFDNDGAPGGPAPDPTPEPAPEPQPKPSGPKEKTYSEAEYKGLQAVIAKRDATIVNLTTEKSELEVQLKAAEAAHGSSETEKGSLATKLSEAEGKVKALTDDKSSLEKKLKFQGIIMKEFPDLAQAASFIPPAETEEEYRANAKEFQEALSQLVNSGVKNILGGASPAIQTPPEGTPDAKDELDEAYKEVVRLAGVPGKEAEYMKANEHYVNLLTKKSNQ